MKRLLFNGDGEGKQLFETIYTGLVMGVSPSARVNGFADVRCEASLLKKFGVISCQRYADGKLATFPTGDPVRELLPGADYLAEITEAEQQLLVRYLQNATWKLSAAVAAVDAVDFVLGAPDVEV